MDFRQGTPHCPRLHINNRLDYQTISSPLSLNIKFTATSTPRIFSHCITIIMYLKVHYKKEIHLLNRKVDFAQLQDFVRSTFKDAPARFDLTYLDSDGDIISLCNQEDLRTLYDTSGEGFTKVIINEVATGIELKQSPLSITVNQNIEVGNESIKVQENQQNAEKAAELQKKEEAPKEVPIEDNAPQERRTEEDIQQKQRQVLPECRKNQDQESKAEKQPKQQALIQDPKVEDDPSADKPTAPVERCQNPMPQNVKVQQEQPQKIEVQAEKTLNQLLLEKLDEFVPFIVQKVKKVLLEEKALENSHIHKVACTACQAQPIRGIRYKCALCQEYNLCSTCQQRTVHSHDLIKVRKPKAEEIQKKVEEPKKAQNAKQASRDEEKVRMRGKHILYRQKEEQTDTKVIQQMMASVKEFLGNSKEVEEFVMKNHKQGVDKIVNMWFSKND